MLQTLFTIPPQIAGIDVFGFGWLLAVWAVVGAILLGIALVRHGWSAETRGQLFALGVVGIIIALVLPMIVQPEGLMVRGYGLMFLLSVVAGVGLSYYRALRRGLNPEIILSLATWLIVAGIVGARLFYVIEYWDKFQKSTLAETIGAMLNLTEGGLVVFGSMLAGGAALVAFVYRYKLPGLALSDLIAPGVVLGAALGRVGCFLNGCCYGGISDVPWAMQFPITSPAYVDQVQRGQLFIHGLIFEGSGSDPAVIAEVEPGSPAERAGLAKGQRVTAVNGKPVDSVERAQFELLSTYGAGTRVAVQVAGEPTARVWEITGPPPRSRPVHPTQLYSLIDSLLLCFFLLVYEPFRRRDGELTALVLTIHPVMRFLLEVIRVDESPVFHTGLSISQNISIGIFVGGVCLWLYLWRRPPGCTWQAVVAPPRRRNEAPLAAGYHGRPI
jgi:phosphatidylglycerol:prolipoprotein diacylglycerol transferase